MFIQFSKSEFLHIFTDFFLFIFLFIFSKITSFSFILSVRASFSLHKKSLFTFYFIILLLTYFFLFSLFLASFISLFHSIHFQVILEMCTKPIWGQNWPQSPPKVLQSKLAKWLCLKNTRKSFYKRYSFIQFSLFFHWFDVHFRAEF